MRRRITAAIVGVTAFILLALGIPLAVVIQRSAVRAELVELQRTAAATLTEIEVPLDAAALAALVNEPDAPPPFAVYDRSGSAVFGQPDPRTEAIAQSALGGASATSSGGELAAATPITDADENVVGALVVTKSLADANATARVAWMVMVAIGIVAVGFAWLIASRLSRRLARPIIELAESAANTGVGGVLAPAEPTGIIEIDVLHDALLDQSRQVNEALARERRFSADVSHQLRTPLAGLRLKIEHASVSDEAERAALIGELDRIDSTVDHLLAFSRDNTPMSATCSPATVLAAGVTEFSGIAAKRSRGLECAIHTTGLAAMSPAALGQAIQVLLDNAVAHGQGDVLATVRKAPGGIAVDVEDGGTIDASVTDDQLFERHQGDHHGIGLSLARSIVEAEGGRLMLTSRQPSRFTVMLLDADEPAD